MTIVLPPFIYHVVWGPIIKSFHPLVGGRIFFWCIMIYYCHLGDQRKTPLFKLCQSTHLISIAQVIRRLAVAYEVAKIGGSSLRLVANWDGTGLRPRWFFLVFVFSIPGHHASFTINCEEQFCHTGPGLPA